MISEKMYNVGIRKSIIRELSDYAHMKKAAGDKPVYDFSIGNPSAPVPEKLTRTMTGLLKNHADTVHQYPPTQGSMNFRKALAEHENRKYGSRLDANNFFITCGAASSLALSLHGIINRPEDEVIVLAPFFPEYRTYINGAGARIVINPPAEDMGIDLYRLEKNISPDTRAVIINSPNNPTGLIYNDNAIKKLAGILKAKEREYGTVIYLISDEPYRELVYDGIKVPYIPDAYDDTIICYSYSKALSVPGERIGYIMAGEYAADKDRLMLALAGSARSLGYICAPTIMQESLAEDVSICADFELYKKNRRRLYEELKRMGYEMIRPEGTFYLFVRALEDDAVSFSETAKDFSLVLVPSDPFGCRGYVRVSYCVPAEVIEAALPSFEALMEFYKRKNGAMMS